MNLFSTITTILRAPLKFVFGLLLLLIPGILKAQCPGVAVGYANPAVGLNLATTGAEAWSNPGNALTDNNSYATMSNAALLIGGTVRNSNFLVLRNLGFDLPRNAQICGVQVEIRKASSDNSGSNYTRDLDIRLLKNNQVVGTNHANAGVNWPTSETAFTYGTNSDLWGTTLSGFEVSNNGFGVAIGIQSRAAGLLLPTVVSYIDQVRIRVYYYTPVIDIDGDGVVDESDNDMDGDGLPNSKELILCNSPESVSLSAIADASLSIPVTAGVTMSLSSQSTSGAGVADFGIAENFDAVAGPEIKISQDVNTASDSSIVSLKFSSPVHNLRFKLQDIDLGAGQFQDNVRVNAYYCKQIYPITAANLTIGSGNFNMYAGNNTFVGLLPMNNNEMNGTISVHLPDMVDSIQFIYKNADVVNLGTQDLGIGEISYCNAYSALQDIDGDGHPGFRDADSDNDGIPDLREIQASVGFIAPLGLDNNNDGLDNAFDLSTGGIALIAVDTDNDGTPDYRDLDSDNDGNSDQIEGNDANRDCIADFALSGIDADGNGLDNSYDTNNGGTAAPLQDSDANGIPDYRENVVPTLSVAGTDQSVTVDSFNLAANMPINGLGYWTTIMGTGTFAHINSPTTIVHNLSMGTNSYVWTIFTDACHATRDTVTIMRSIPLPVHMSGLSVRAEGARAVLNWHTLSEQNNKGFGVLHSVDGRQWQQLQFVPSLAFGGNSQNTLQYEVYDMQALKGRNYYQIFQQDMDGAKAYSAVQSLWLEGNNELVIYPNPVQTSITLADVDGQNIKRVQLLDAGGKIIFLSKAATIKYIDMTDIAAGVYLLKIYYQNGTEKGSTIVKQ
ncbi:hypothetical protein DBR32_07700 [Taibaiella sp. KBW10]|uniref:T9SS type A sorting domain-containing protein n=1 Tax=Taibaiella sp. KBW10 TaxID=2153357 RepID=UPI000F5B6718|nr:T9SS type A sorting domain-containing protein [Taibaiella sp. KBW10]RQO31815.1 hypothetical protein DBR32_07700 [Taibaiella sp. KBW10]